MSSLRQCQIKTVIGGMPQLDGDRECAVFQHTRWYQFFECFNKTSRTADMADSAIILSNITNFQAALVISAITRSGAMM